MTSRTDPSRSFQQLADRWERQASRLRDQDAPARLADLCEAHAADLRMHLKEPASDFRAETLPR